MIKHLVDLSKPALMKRFAGYYDKGILISNQTKLNKDLIIRYCPRIKGKKPIRLNNRKGGGFEIGNLGENSKGEMAIEIIEDSGKKIFLTIQQVIDADAINLHFLYESESAPKSKDYREPPLGLNPVSHNTYAPATAGVIREEMIAYNELYSYDIDLN